MRQTIEDLFNGRITPYDQQHVRTVKYLEAEGKMAKLEERLLGLLGDSVWEAYQDAQADMMGECDREDFMYGFQLCAKLIL